MALRESVVEACFGTLLTFIFVALFAYLFGLITYRVYFHPLAKYPGPLFGKCTDLYQTYHAWKGDRHLEFWRCHKHYGSIVRFGPNSISFNTNTALRDIYSSKANVRKSNFYSGFPADKNVMNTHSAIDKAEHARKRRVLSPAFSDNAMRAMETNVLAHVRQFCSNLGEVTAPTAAYSDDGPQWTLAKNITYQANYMTFDVMGDLCFGKSFNMLSSPRNRFAIDLITNATRRHLICATFSPLHEFGLDKALFRKIAAQRARYLHFSQSQAAERIKMGEDVDRNDFFYFLLKAADPETGEGFSKAELWAESNLLIIAGSDTTSTALSAAIFYLVHNPRVLGILSREIRTAFQNVEEIRIGAKLNAQTYLRACIDEAMRLSPPVGGLLQRQVLPGGMNLDGHWFPDGTVVGVPHYAIHYNPAYYPEPFSYMPERWLSSPSNSSDPGTPSSSE